MYKGGGGIRTHEVDDDYQTLQRLNYVNHSPTNKQLMLLLCESI